MEYGGGMGGGYGGFGGGGGFSGFEGMGGDDLTGGGGFLDGTAGKSAEKKNRDNQSITSVSIKQLNTAESDDGEMFRVDGMQLYQVKIIGFIESMATHSTSQMYMINDGSGVIECKAFIEKNEGGGSSAPMESMLWYVSNLVYLFILVDKYFLKIHFIFHISFSFLFIFHN